MTTSTAGMSFNSPPATARDCGYDQDAHGGAEVDADCMDMANYYTVDGDQYEQMLFNPDANKTKRNICN